MVSSQIPGFTIDDTVLLVGFLLTLGLGLAAGCAPAWRARSLRPVVALRLDV
jgi:ABC-type antimicrobial peptide transport system permease subunit